MISTFLLCIRHTQLFIRECFTALPNFAPHEKQFVEQTNTKGHKGIYSFETTSERHSFEYRRGFAVMPN